MKCFYHNDMDGKCAAAIVQYFYQLADSKIDFIKMSYDRTFPFERIDKNEKVFIVDFSLQKEGEFEELLKITDDVVWIDHHKSAIEKHVDIMLLVDGIQSVKQAGCFLTWSYFYPDRSVPRIIKLLGDYDIWRFEYGDETRDLQAGIKLEETHPCYHMWQTWFNNDLSIESIIANGAGIRKFISNESKDKIKAIGFYAELDGYKCICCNNALQGSTLFDSVNPETYDFMMPFYCSDRGWTVSLYNTKGIDGTVIAEKYGGGGHPGACGFQCRQLYFKDGIVEAKS